ncbi:unnamed protein product [Rhizoctonia solani]|uniref:Uncharacterized protein n=1 Tax=Rhizoctonia solani TaxID=456999 RepID=A0A8H2X7M6_9AGAM|nr:unnamed protein product [Rhizoctonia solani]
MYCTDLVPPRGNAPRSYWYLGEHYEEVLEKSRQFREAGDRDTWKVWSDERGKIVRACRERATPLVEWVENREEEYRAGLRTVREDRAIEIEARLIELGWEMADIQTGEYYSDKWKPLVSKTKPLDEKDWDDMLPHLLYGLKKARQRRLKVEADKRQSARLHSIDDWLRSSPDVQVSITLRWRDLSRRPTLGSVETSIHSEGAKKRDFTVEVSSYPSRRYLLQSGQSYLEVLLDQDKPMEEFQLEFQDKRANLRERTYMGWRPNLEASLVKRLPENLVPADIATSDFYLQTRIGNTNPKILDNRLSSDLRKLLRADVRFMHPDGAVYYPKGFDDWTVGKYSPTFDPVSSAVAKILLSALQRPNASYLEMQALDGLFVCGRCSRERNYFSWGGIVEHYLYEHEQWKKACRRNARFSKAGKRITFVFTHDTHAIDHAKPLVNLVAEQDRTLFLARSSPVSICNLKLCSGIGHHYETAATYIVRHVQEVWVFSPGTQSSLVIDQVSW